MDVAFWIASGNGVALRVSALEHSVPAALDPVRRSFQLLDHVLVSGLPSRIPLRWDLLLCVLDFFSYLTVIEKFSLLSVHVPKPLAKVIVRVSGWNLAALFAIVLRDVLRDSAPFA